MDLFNDYSEGEILLAKELAREDGLIWNDAGAIEGSDTPPSMTDDDMRQYLERARRQWKEQS